MAGFEVFKDDLSEISHVSANPILLKGTKVDLVPRSPLSIIDTNKVKDPKLYTGKSLKSKITVFHDKDVSEAFKEVKLDSKEDELIEKKDSKQRLPLAEKEVVEPVNDSQSDISFDISSSEVDEQFSYAYKIKVHNDFLYDCITYRDDIYEYLRSLELKFRAKPFYMRKQPDISYTMRSILIDWLVEVAEEYKLQGETLFMAISYVDRFLSTMAVVRTKLQLLGTSAMFVAAKYEEIYPPDVGEFTYITDDTYTKKQVLKMEHLILKTLNFDISAPTHFTFITHLTKVGSIDSHVSNLALYICELSLLEGDPYLQFAPSLVACAAIALARHCLRNIDVWPSDLAHISGYSLRHLAPVLPHLNKTHGNAPTLTQTASRDKYKGAKYFGVSIVPHKDLIVRDPLTSESSNANALS